MPLRIPPITSTATLSAFLNTAFGTRESPSSTYTSAVTLTSAQLYVRGDASGGAFTITLPAAIDTYGDVITIKKTTTTNAITVAAAGSDTIDGSATTSLAAGSRSIVRLRSYGTGYDIV